jgi:CDGSH-type Zn-finger protein
MTSDDELNTSNQKKILIKKNGPYVVAGDILLVRKTQIVSEYGEPLAWKKEETIETGETYELCRCGCSKNMPFCDKTHRTINFDGTETAETTNTAERQRIYTGGTKIIAKRDHHLCMNSGFCGTRFTNVKRMLADTGDTRIRSLLIAMIERCPSGSYTYALEEGEADIEPDLPQQIAVTTEITSNGPIDGPLWVTGYIPIERSDGLPFELRNRVTLCNCGLSKIKPLCDGTHRPPDVTNNT